MQLVFTILNSLGLVGLGVFLYFVFNGLLRRIENLKTLAEEQKNTLDAVRERAEEFDKLSKAYKQALTDFQEMGEKLETRRQEVVKELEDANRRKDEEIVHLKTAQLAEIDIQKKSFERLPELEKRLQSVVSELQRQLMILSPSWFSESSGSHLQWPSKDLLQEIIVPSGTNSFVRMMVTKLASDFRKTIDAQVTEPKVPAKSGLTLNNERVDESLPPPDPLHPSQPPSPQRPDPRLANETSTQ